MATNLAVVKRGLTQTELIEIESLFNKLAIATGKAERESRNIRMTAKRGDELVAAAFKVIKEIRDLWEWDADEPEADL
jgi:hypothetical protein